MNFGEIVSRLPGGILLILIGLPFIIFNEAIGEYTVDHWSLYYPRTFWVIWHRVMAVLLGIFLITLGILIMIGVTSGTVNFNGIFLIVLGLLIIIFYKTIARQTYEFWKPIFPHPFFILYHKIVAVLGGIFLTTLGILILIGL